MPIYKEYLNHTLGLTLSTPGIVVIILIIKKFTNFRKFVKGVYRFFLVGIVTGNPSSCFPKTLPDVYNFVGNEKVSGKSTGCPRKN